MFFKKELPPPPPKPKVPDWVKVAIPIIFIIITGLLGIVYNGLAEDVGGIEKKLEQKVDNKTLQLQIEALSEKQKESKEYRDKTDRRIESILQKLQKLIIQQGYSKVPTANKEKYTDIRVDKKDNNLDIETYKFYMSLSEEHKLNFKKLNPKYEELK